MPQRQPVRPNQQLIDRLHAACVPDGVLDLAADRSAFAFGWRDLPLIGDSGLPETAPATPADKRPEQA